ncbi:hypothetical protein DUNSADRAFT_13609 [Dunaliella salina]|uniref:Uncharacterized protein n=1 Tax=Dunaliella salina TaxID=3046 RepID=A0ABQ7G952_DUNSA|nr:hypothetical protein DUNSADRAFT_13609 [Dunaliella salina]|eukprot:KAF5831102.1 hypothetical protein DUNSADRAFT_13609 [Dunaliella salina]
MMSTRQKWALTVCAGAVGIACVVACKHMADTADSPHMKSTWLGINAIIILAVWGVVKNHIWAADSL